MELFRVKYFSVQGEYYATNFESCITTEFVKTGVTY